MDVYLLEGKIDGVLAIYSSLDILKEGVDYWVKYQEEHNITQTLIWVKYEMNYHSEPIEWDWAWIDPISTTEALMAGGASEIPTKEFRGINLIDVRFDTVDGEEVGRLYDLNKDYEQCASSA